MEKIKQFLNGSDSLLALTVTALSILVCQCVGVLFLFLFEFRRPDFLMLVAFVEPLLATPPAVLTFCLLRGELMERHEGLLETNAQLEQALLSIRELGALLPMCASCKKVRTDEGYLRQMEAYVSKHTSAVFTHGICPDCYEKVMLEIGRSGEKS